MTILRAGRGRRPLVTGVVATLVADARSSPGAVAVSVTRMRWRSWSAVGVNVSVVASGSGLQSVAPGAAVKVVFAREVE